jgi:HK97 family phage portal protein
MGILSRSVVPVIKAWKETYLSDNVVDFYNGGPTSSGIRVGTDAAMRISTFWACTNVLSQDVGKAPLILYRRLPGGGRERAVDHPLYALLHDRPNAFQTPYRFKQAGQTATILRGNYVAGITRYRGRIRELLPIQPGRIQIKLEPDYRLSYKLDGKERSASDFLHIRGLSLDGYTGVSLATWARESLGLAAATEGHGARLFSRGALFRGVLYHPGKMKNEEVARRTVESFDAMYSGDQDHSTALLEDGTKYEKMQMTAEDSQFLQTREFQAYEIARWFRMPPHKVGLLKEAKYATIEHAALEYVIDTLLSWLVNWEQECNHSLLEGDDREELYFEFLVDHLLRGDIKSRYEAYKSAILTGFMNRNEARERENLNPAEGLDEFLEPANMLPAGEPRGESDPPDPPAARAQFRLRDAFLRNGRRFLDDGENDHG